MVHRKWYALTLAGLTLLLFSAVTVAQQPINEGMRGSWYNPATSGQGLFMDVDEERQFLFIAWFTFTPDAEATDGIEALRWYTAQGNYSGDSANIILYETTGSLFDAPDTSTTVAIGTVDMTFNSCTSATFNYDNTRDGLSGSIEMVRLTPDVVCADLTPSEKSDTTITYIGNEGVYVDDGESGVFLDAIGVFTGWIDASPTTHSNIANVLPPYDLAVAVTVSHNHSDHFGTTTIRSFLTRKPDTDLLVVGQIRGSFAGVSQLSSVNPPRFSSAVHTAGDIEITVINTRHFNQFGNNFAGLDNNVYVVDIGGWKVMHTGDIDYATDNFAAIQDAIGPFPDVIILPTFNTLISQTNRDLVRQFFPDAQIIGSHFQASRSATEAAQLLALFPNAVIFDTPLETFELTEN